MCLSCKWTNFAAHSRLTCVVYSDRSWLDSFSEGHLQAGSYQGVLNAWCSDSCKLITLTAQNWHVGYGRTGAALIHFLKDALATLCLQVSFRKGYGRTGAALIHFLKDACETWPGHIWSCKGTLNFTCLFFRCWLVCREPREAAGYVKHLPPFTNVHDLRRFGHDSKLFCRQPLMLNLNDLNVQWVFVQCI